MTAEPFPDPAGLPNDPDDLRRTLRESICAAMQLGAERDWSDDEFALLATAVFRYQSIANPVYGAFARERTAAFDGDPSWWQIPAVPVRAFKRLRLLCENGPSVEAVFRTSGTTDGGQDRGAHHVRDLALYECSAITTAQHYLDIQNRTRMRILCLLPDPADSVDSSLSRMGGFWMTRWDDGEGGYFVDSSGKLRVAEIERAIRSASRDGLPVILLGTAFALVHLLDRLGEEARLPLPQGSLLVETGGFKGRSRTVSRDDLYAALTRLLCLPESSIVNEYGMTEMLSQFYEPIRVEGALGSLRDRRHRGPPWVRTQVLDPRTLAPVDAGEPGILCHLDLANLDSVSAILTEDLGIAEGDGFRLLGRNAGAEPRGCSLTMEALLAARRAVP